MGHAVGLRTLRQTALSHLGPPGFRAFFERARDGQWTDVDSKPQPLRL